MDVVDEEQDGLRRAVHGVEEDGHGIVAVPGSAVYTEADCYGVVDRNAAVLQGHVLDLDHAGLDNMDVLIEGIGSTNGDYIATTGGGGFFSAISTRAATASVCARSTSTGGACGKSAGARRPRSRPSGR